MIFHSFRDLIGDYPWPECSIGDNEGADSFCLEIELIIN